jgi:hypothetical protein
MGSLRQMMIGSTTTLPLVLPSTTRVYVWANLKRQSEAIAGRRCCLNASKNPKSEHDAETSEMSCAAQGPGQGTLAGAKGWGEAGAVQTTAA